MYRDQVVLITGSSRGLGAKLVEHFIARGAVVIGFSRSAGEFKHPRYRHFPVDIREEKQVRAAFASVRSEFGKVDILINNAGVAVSQFTVLTPLSAAEDVLRTNFLGAFIVTREAAKLMMAKKYGRIIMLSSVFVPLAPAGGGMYSASKAALTQFARVLAKETADHGITCNVLGIAAIETEMWKDIPKKKLLSLVGGLSRKGLSTLEDITNAVDFLASKASVAVTAQALYLGGAH